MLLVTSISPSSDAYHGPDKGHFRAAF
jgi:hypothetical protein